MHQRHAVARRGFGENARSLGVGAHRRGRVALGRIDGVVGGGIDDERWRDAGDRLFDRILVGDIGRAVAERRQGHAGGPCRTRQFAAKLAVCAEHQDQSARPSRSPR